MLSPSGIRRIHTLRKLPITMPYKKMKINIIVFTDIGCPAFEGFI
jgi:hypothetical protein